MSGSETGAEAAGGALVTAFYAPLSRCAVDARRVGWESDEAHALRLARAIDALGDLDAIGALLDVGCGEGALVGRLRERGFRGSYRGEDLLHSMVESARARAPAERFEVHDLLAPGPSADAVVLSGALNTRQGPDQDDLARRALTALWARTRAVLVVDVAVADRHPGGPGLAPVDLAGLWAHARQLGAVVSVSEDGPAGEALLVLRRSRRGALERHLPLAAQAPARAAILLTAGEPSAALEALAGHSTLEAELQRALAWTALGRARDAERLLRRLADAGMPAARLHLGALTLATGRAAEGEPLLTALAAGSDPLADEARLVLAGHHLRGGRPEAARALASAILDPFLARHAAALAEGALSR
ncbi:MAG: class I SAM-dependent methyltransferase [Deltaproteobacteria bacterium]|nr:class I SAM-dependent methyltransferase [Deltaproteobacteria bacterium]